MSKSQWLYFIIVILFSSCVSSKITSAWTNPKSHSLSFHKIIVVSIINDKSWRLNMEQQMASDLNALGYNAYSAFNEYGLNVFDLKNEDEMKARFKADSIEAVLTIVLLDKRRERYYIPYQVFNPPYGLYAHDFYGYYRSMRNRIDDPGYYSDSTKYFWESNIYNINSNEWIYSIQTHSFNPASKESLADEYSQVIVKNMLKKRVLFNLF